VGITRCEVKFFDIAKVNTGVQQIMKKSADIWNYLDRIDRKILGELQKNGRISNLDLSSLVALSPTAALSRVQRLTRDGYIIGYEARLNPIKLDAGMTVFVEVILDRTTANVFNVFSAAAQAHDEIQECHMISGDFDLLLKIRCADMQGYRTFAGDILWQLPGVRETRSYTVIEEIKNTTHIKLL